MAWGLYKMRRDIAHLPFGVFKHNKKIGVTSLCDVDGGKDLIPVTIFDGHQLELLEYAGILASKTSRAKKNTDKEHTKATGNMAFLPSFIGQPVLYILTYIGMQLGISIKPIGLRNDQFGHTVLTNVGPLGYKEAFAPLCPIAHTTSLICTGTIEKRPIVNEKGEIEIADMMTAVATGDHRYGDAAIFIPFFKCVRGYLDDPENFDHTKYPETIHYKEREEKEKAAKLAEKSAAPVEKAAAPVEKKEEVKAAAPVEKQAEPVKEAAVPVEKQAEPVKEAAAPVEKQAEPVKEAAPPVEKQAEPVKEAPAPVEKEAAPVENQGEPVQPPAAEPKEAEPVEKIEE